MKPNPVPLDLTGSTTCWNISLMTHWILKEVLNNIWESANFLHQWGAATVIPIPKPNKGYTDPLSYRLIALTSCLCKVLECIINSHLIWYLEKSWQNPVWLQKALQHNGPLGASRKVRSGCFCTEAAGSWFLLWLRKGLWNNLTIPYHTRSAQDWAQRQIACFRVRISQGSSNSSQNRDHSLRWILPKGKCSNELPSDIARDLQSTFCWWLDDPFLGTLPGHHS